MEKFIERGTTYKLDHGQLIIYETNCSCKDVKFYFEQSIMTVMLSGHKSISSRGVTYEFFPGTFYIPEIDQVHNVTISSASMDNPTKCIVLELDPSFINNYYEETLNSDLNTLILDNESNLVELDHYFSNNKDLVECFARLFEYRIKEANPQNQMICTLLIKEILLRVFTTDGLSLLKKGFQDYKVDSQIQKSIVYIKKNFHKKITASQLASLSGLGLTSFFQKFKNSTGLSPVDYILSERIKKSKIFIQKNHLTLKEIGFNCGFNSYEYFCTSFKKIVNQTPSNFKRNSK